MRLLTFMLALLAMPAAALAQPIPAADIIKVLPDVWAMGMQKPPSTELTFDCKADALHIRIERGGSGKHIYISEFRDTDGKVYASRSTVRYVSNLPAFGMGGIVLQYDDEDRLDDKGRPVQWVLLMPDKDKFYWHRVDWRAERATAPSRRCHSPDLVG
jgi:hypothetical protein